MSDKKLQLYDYDSEKKLSETASKTKDALNKILSRKLHNDKVTTLASTSTNSDTSYLQYTSAQLANLTNDEGLNAPKRRIIKITDEKVDPMLPQKFRIRKAPDGPPADGFAPVLHDETSTEKLTKADQKKWQIAPSVSNWKNNQGFIIGIENRLQNSNTPNKLTEQDINKSTQRFSALSDALKNAEQKAKEDLKTRANWRKRLESEEIARTQERLGRLAEEARNSRKTAQETITDFSIVSANDNLSRKGQEEDSSLSDKLQRRAERRRRAEEELKSEKLSTKQKIRKLAKEQGREISERVVLGVSEALRKKQKESVYDSELYLRTSHSAKGKPTDDLYDKPLFSQETALGDIYRSRNMSGHKGLGSTNDTEPQSTSVNFVRDSDAEKKRE
ncbi:hypothetical protein PICMEDRAFT_14191 [Pichia membranifaciens NRRL Y-2026]|uniref:Pre-mRNA-processing protein 45 n=1 Tax=Pichia membranifaciens NRRL Y-2026 TaxID=763406 RepID=A0A1E3NRF3_9ASCO|nr:hypothetical protein PICMEDRAFT_14191 [Pichia membranifaciens NRRL Y-2026]ODQ48654.1 hypothetical protein PICMEDRAFT_14191 [Pichia membranifaciens NRRL Y-2026]